MNEIDLAAPIACTLDRGSFSKRMEWIADLNLRALRSARRDDLRLELEYAPEAIEDVRQMVRQERECCSFLDFDLAERPGAVTLAITAPEAARDAAEHLFGPFREKAPLASAATWGCAAQAPSTPAATTQLGNRTAGAVAATASTAALACGVCCVLPFALPAVMLGSVGGVLAWFIEAHRWMTPVAVLAVLAGWAWVGYQSHRSGRRPAKATLVIMALATIVMALALLWPSFERTITMALRR